MSKIKLLNIAENIPQDIINNKDIAKLAEDHIRQFTDEALTILKEINPDITHENANKIVKEKLLIDLTLPMFINSNNAEEIYNYAKSMPINEQQLKELVTAIIRTKNAEYIYKFAKDVENAPAEELATAIIETKNNFYILAFAKNVPNAPIQELAGAIIKSNSAEDIYKLFFIIELSIENTVEAMINTRDAKFNYNLYCQLKDLLNWVNLQDNNDLFILTTKNYQKINLTKEEVIKKINVLLILVENALINIANAKYIYHLAENNIHNLELIVRLANAMAKINDIGYDEAGAIIDFIKLIEKINLPEHVNKEEIISNLIDTLVSTKSIGRMRSAYSELKHLDYNLTKAIINTKDIKFIKSFMNISSFYEQYNLITIEQFYEEAIQLNDIELILNFIRSDCNIKHVNTIISLIQREKIAQHIYRLAQMIIEEMEKGNRLFNPKHLVIKFIIKELAIDVIETEDIEYIKLFRDNILYVNKNLLNRAIKEIEIKNKYSFRHKETGPRESADKGISRVLAKPTNHE